MIYILRRRIICCSICL